MGNKSKRESRFNLLKLKDSDFESQDLNQRMASIEYLGDFINVRRVKKITLHI